MNKKQMFKLSGRIVWEGLKVVALSAVGVAMTKLAESGIEGVKSLTYIDLLKLEEKRK